MHGFKQTTTQIRTEHRRLTSLKFVKRKTKCGMRIIKSDILKYNVIKPALGYPDFIFIVIIQNH